MSFEISDIEVSFVKQWDIIYAGIIMIEKKLASFRLRKIQGAAKVVINNY